ncbi:MAG TPA: hypothetical protein PLQ56_18340 [Aggregatilineales bacterium]|nr:hypothetical protein [Aggregatilineales bacterium]
MTEIDKASLQETLFSNRPTDSQAAQAWDDRLAEQYKLYVEMMDKVSERRIAANTLFLSTNTGLVTLYVAAIALLADLNIINSTTILNLLTIVVGLCGVVLCGFWYALINSYRDLNSGKFAVIHELEQKLPARLYAAEWIGMGKVEKQSGYIPFTHIEVWIPVVFIVIYLFVMMSLLSAFSARTPAPPTPMPVIIVTATPLSTTPEAIIMPLPTNTP